MHAAKRMASGFDATSATALSPSGQDKSTGEGQAVPLLVMTGPTGRGFYEKYGFQCVHQVKMEGDVEYTEYILLWETGAGT